MKDICYPDVDDQRWFSNLESTHWLDHIKVCVCISVFLYVSMCLCVYLCLCVYVSVCIHVCVCVSLCLSVSVSMCLCAYVSVCICVCVSICVCVFVCVCVGGCELVILLWVGVNKSMRLCVCLCCLIQCTYMYILYVHILYYHILLQAILCGAVKVVEAIEHQKSSVIVHCTDGWDRTAQISSLSMLIMDSYFRTIRGFEVRWLNKLIVQLRGCTSHL